MNGFLPFEKEVDAMHVGNGHHNAFATNSFPSSSSNPYPEYTTPSPTNQYANNMDRPPQMQHHQQNHLPRQGSWPAMYHQTQQIQHHIPNPAQGQMAHMQHQHQQQFNQQWNPPMPQQAFPNAARGMPVHMNGVGGGAIPFMNPQMMQDAMGIHKQEEEILLRALVNAQHQRMSYRHAINSLHTVNNHGASVWKDHYLEHKYRLDDLVSNYLARKQPSVKKPTLESFKVETKVETSGSPVPSGIVKSQSKGALRKSSTPSSSHAAPQTGSRRHTINSLTVHTAAFDRHLPPPHADLKVPQAPSRSPTPPTLVIPKGRGNKFTDQDKAFFLKFIQRRLKEDPSLTRNDLCEKLAEKAPHHSVQSWGSYWSNNHDLPDKILAAAKGEGLEYDDSESEEEVKIMPRRRRPRYKEISSDEEDEVEETIQDADEDAEADEDDDEDDNSMPDFDESAMGDRGGPFTEADFAITARHIASFPDFSIPTAHEKWVPYSEKYPQRSAKSWAEYYRRNEEALEKLATKIRRQNPPPTSASKRKLRDEDEDDKGSKHAKVTP